jgi:hypothetical protein
MVRLLKNLCRISSKEGLKDVMYFTFVDGNKLLKQMQE